MSTMKTPSFINPLVSICHSISNLSTTTTDNGFAALPSLSEFVSHGAAYDSEERHPHPRCHPGTRTSILDEVYQWVDDTAPERKILWLHGPAGAGKSSIAQTVAERCAERGQLAASFFFSRTDPRRNSRKYLFSTLAMQIAMTGQDKRGKLERRLTEEPSIVHRLGGFVELISIMYEHPDPPTPSPQIVLVDGLDECTGDEAQQLILTEILRLFELQVPVRFFILSRPEAQIHEAFAEPRVTGWTQELPLYNDYRARRDVEAYLRTEFDRIRHSPRHRCSMNSAGRLEWPLDKIIKKLTDKAGGYFIYAATVIRFIDGSKYSTCVELLDQILQPNGVSGELPFDELDKLYMRILLACPQSHRFLLKRILGFFILHDFDIYDVQEMDSILDLPMGKVATMLRALHSLIRVNEDGSIDLYHASFVDFLRDPDRSKDIHIDTEAWYEEVSSPVFAALHQDTWMLDLDRSRYLTLINMKSDTDKPRYGNRVLLPFAIDLLNVNDVWGKHGSKALENWTLHGLTDALSTLPVCVFHQLSASLLKRLKESCC
jgi:hypothetical protein